MNTLSWLIYAADVAGDLDGLLFFFSILATVVVLIWAIVGCIMADDGADDPKSWAAWRRTGFLLIIPVFFLSWIFGAIVPARETVYAIAASEVGESALESETAGKAFKALNAWLDKQIGTEAPAEEASKEEEK